MSPDNPPGLAFYTIGSQDTIPTTAPANLVSLSGIRNAMQTRMHGTGFTDSLVIGVYWHGAPIPTTPIRDSTLVEVEVNTSVELGTLGTVTGVPTPAAPRGAWLAPPLPNPAPGSFTLRFAQPREARASLSIYDVSGRLVRQVERGELTAGEHVVRWNGRDDAGGIVPAGIYFLRLDVDGDLLTRRLVVVR
jgi:hypothetical protein